MPKATAMWCCKSKGFTLIELLVTMTIMAILFGLAMVSYQGARKSSRDSRRKADLQEVRSALEMRRADCGSYPTGNLSSGRDIACNAVVYLTIPNDPLSSGAYDYTSSDGQTYKLCAALEIDPGTSYADCGGNCGTGCNYQVKNP